MAAVANADCIRPPTPNEPPRGRHGELLVAAQAGEDNDMSSAEQDNKEKLQEDVEP